MTARLRVADFRLPSRAIYFLPLITVQNAPTSSANEDLKIRWLEAATYDGFEGSLQEFCEGASPPKTLCGYCGTDCEGKCGGENDPKNAFVLSPASAHTAGPWETNVLDLVIYKDDLIIAHVHDVDDPENEEGDITSANARLIAAAPSLDEALRQMIAAIEEMLDADDLQMTSYCGDLLLQIVSIGTEALRPLSDV